MQVPGANNVTVVDETEHVLLVALVNATARELEDVADTVNVSIPVVFVFPDIAEKVID